jgi:N-acetylneuraminic acid mutarotase
MPDGSIVLTGGSSDTVPSYNDVWRSTDNGATWTEMTADAGWSGRNGLSVVATPDNSIVLMGGNDFNGDKSDIWRSTDDGATWTEMNPHAGWPPRSYQSSVAMQDGSIVLMGGVGDTNNNISHYNDVWRSTDDGATWTEMNPHAGWPPRLYQSSVAMQDGSIILVGGEDTGGRHPDNVLRSTDYGATWVEITAHAGWSGREGQSIVAMPDNSLVLMGGYANSYLNDVWRSVPTSS